MRTLSNDARERIVYSLWSVNPPAVFGTVQMANAKNLYRDHLKVSLIIITLDRDNIYFDMIILLFFGKARRRSSLGVRRLANEGGRRKDIVQMLFTNVWHNS